MIVFKFKPHFLCEDKTVNIFQGKREELLLRNRKLTKENPAKRNCRWYFALGEGKKKNRVFGASVAPTGMAHFHCEWGSQFPSALKSPRPFSLKP